MLIALLLGWLSLGGHGGGELWFFGGRTAHGMRAEVAKIVSDKEMQNTTNYNLSLIETEYKKDARCAPCDAGTVIR